MKTVEGMCCENGGNEKKVNKSDLIMMFVTLITYVRLNVLKNDYSRCYVEGELSTDLHNKRKSFSTLIKVASFSHFREFSVIQFKAKAMT